MGSDFEFADRQQCSGEPDALEDFEEFVSDTRLVFREKVRRNAEKDQAMAEILHRYGEHPYIHQFTTSLRKKPSKYTAKRYLRPARLQNLRYRILNADEEVKFSEQVQTGIHELEAAEPDETALVEAAAAHRALVLCNQGLVKVIANELLENSVGLFRSFSFQELAQYGFIGLHKAIVRFAPAESRFSTYGGIWINQSIRRAVADNSRLIRLPVHAHQDWRSIVLHKARRENLLHRDISPEELSEDLGYRIDYIKLLLRRGTYDNEYLDDQTVESYQREERVQLPEQFPDEADDFDEVIDRVGSLNYSNRNLISSPNLKLKQKIVLGLRLGFALDQLADEEIAVNFQTVKVGDVLAQVEVGEYTLRQIGDMLGLTRERIRVLELEALKTLKKETEGLAYENPQPEPSSRLKKEQPKHTPEQYVRAMMRIQLGDLALKALANKDTQRLRRLAEIGERAGIPAREIGSMAMEISRRRNGEILAKTG
jgi:RNA polymerase primary sigma factor